MGMTVSGYARHRGVSHVAVLNAIKNGRISKGKDGKIDPIQADREWEENTDKSKQRGKTVSSPSQASKSKTQDSDTNNNESHSAIPDYQTSRAKREAANAARAEHQLRVDLGQVINVESVEREVTALYRRTRDRLMLVGHRLSPLIAAEGDVVKCKKMIEDEISQAIDEMSKWNATS